MSEEQEIDKDDQLDNLIIFGQAETFLFFTFPISSVAHCLTAAFLHSLWLRDLALASIWRWHLVRTQATQKWRIDCFKAARFENRTQANILSLKCAIQTRATSHLSLLHHSRIKRRLSTSLVSGETFPLNIWPPLDEYSLSSRLLVATTHTSDIFLGDWNVFNKRTLSILVAWSKTLDYLVSFHSSIPTL